MSREDMPCRTCNGQGVYISVDVKTRQEIEFECYACGGSGRAIDCYERQPNQGVPKMRGKTGDRLGRGSPRRGMQATSGPAHLRLTKHRKVWKRFRPSRGVTPAGE